MVVRPDDRDDGDAVADLHELCLQINRTLIRRAANPDIPPPHFGRFEVRAILGRGGYGCVFRAWDPKLGREVAVKVCRHDRAEQTAILLGEARTIARLSHPNIITVHDFDTHDDKLFFVVMEYVDGPSLYQWAVDEEQPSQQLIEVFAGIARGVEAAHDRA